MGALRVLVTVGETDLEAVAERVLVAETLGDFVADADRVVVGEALWVLVIGAVRVGLTLVLAVVEGGAETLEDSDREPEVDEEALGEADSDEDGSAELLADAVGLCESVAAAVTVHVGVDDRVAERLWDLVGSAVSEAVRLELREPEGEPVDVRDTDMVLLTVLE